MEIISKLFLLFYLLAVVLVTIIGVVWFLSAIFKPEWITKKALIIKIKNIRS